MHESPYNSISYIEFISMQKSLGFPPIFYTYPREYLGQITAKASENSPLHLF